MSRSADASWGKIPTTRVRLRISRCSLSSPLMVRILLPPAPRKIKHCETFIQVVFQPAHELRCNLFELLDDFTLELLGILSRRSIENVPHGLGDAGLVLFAASILLGVFAQVKLTTVPGHRRINCPPGRLQSFVIVTDKQLDPSPRLCRSPRNPRQCTSASLILALRPNTSRVPKRLTPMAFRIATSCTLPPLRTFS